MKVVAIRKGHQTSHRAIRAEIEVIAARRGDCQCAEIIDCADAIAGKIRARAAM